MQLTDSSSPLRGYREGLVLGQDSLRLQRIERLAFLAVLLATVALGIIRQPYYPATWIDEGFVLQGAINLVQYGEYALRSAEGFREFDQPLIANGPGLILPISLAFKLFGIGLLQARIVMVLYMVATIALLYIITRYLYGVFPALIASVLVLLIPKDGFLLFGRQAIGAIPAIAYFLGGIYFWFKAFDREQSRYIFRAGILFGLAAITKGQYLLIVPMIVLVGLADYFYYHSRAIKKVALILVTMLACLLVWYGIQYIELGHEAFLNNLAALKSSSKETVTALRPLRYPGNIWYLVYSGIIFVVMPGWCMAALECLERSKTGLRLLLPVIFIPAWLAWFAFVSVGWHRYALDPFVIGAVFAGQFVYSLITELRSDRKPNSFSFLNSQRIRKLSGAYLGLLSLFALFGLGYHSYILLSQPNTSPQAFSSYLQEQISSDSVIETWEWEITSLAPELTYHLPTNDWVDLMTRKTQYLEEVEISYDLRQYGPEYLIDGPFSKWTEMYSASIAEGCCERVISVGLYDLYKVQQSD